MIKLASFLIALLLTSQANAAFVTDQVLSTIEGGTVSVMWNNIGNTVVEILATCPSSGSDMVITWADKGTHGGTKVCPVGGTMTPIVPPAAVSVAPNITIFIGANAVTVTDYGFSGIGVAQ